MKFTGHNPKDPLPPTWTNREAVTSALLEVASDFEARPDTWEHENIASYLEALGALLGSIEHSYAIGARNCRQTLG